MENGNSSFSKEKIEEIINLFDEIEDQILKIHTDFQNGIYISIENLNNDMEQFFRQYSVMSRLKLNQNMKIDNAHINPNSEMQQKISDLHQEIDRLNNTNK